MMASYYGVISFDISIGNVVEYFSVINYPNEILCLLFTGFALLVAIIIIMYSIYSVSLL